MKSQTKKIELSIVLPVFNEEKNIPLIVNKYRELSKKINLEVIFVEDGGSTDNTRKEVEKFSKENSFLKHLFITEKGYGISIFKGSQKAKGEFLCWTHADMQTPPEDTLRALDLVKKQKNPEKTFVKGKRYGRPLFDSFFAFGMSIFETLILRKPLYDINAQPNLFHSSFLDIIKDPAKDFSFDLYMYYLARKNKYEIIRFPVFFGKRLHGESKWNTGLKSKYKFIKRTMKFSFELKKRLKD